MEFIRAFVRQYWVNLLALAVFIVALARYTHVGRWVENIEPFAYAAGGLLCVIASDEVAEWTGGYLLTRSQFFVWPTTVLRSLGGLALIVGTIRLFMG